jgi:ABC-type amino acid transport substrate-binding protein
MTKADMRQYTTSEEAYLDLQAGRIDAMLVDTIPGEEWLKSDPAIAADFAPVSANLYDMEWINRWCWRCWRRHFKW